MAAGLERVLFVPTLQGAAVAAEGRTTVIIDLPFDVPLAPARMSLAGRAVRGWYKRHFKREVEGFIDGLGRNLLRWIDHHDHGMWPEYQDDGRFLLGRAVDSPACACLITPELFDDPNLARAERILCHNDLDGVLSAALFLRQGRPPYPAAWADAVAADTRSAHLSPAGDLLDKALKVRRDPETLQWALRWLVLGDEKTEKALRSLADQHRTLEEQTVRLMARTRAVGSTGVLDARHWPGQPDITGILLGIQKRHRAALVLRGDEHDDPAFLAGNIGRPLPSVLGLPGGGAQRVRLRNAHLGEAVELLEAALGDQGTRPALPRRAMVEATRRCNLTCVGCPVGNGAARPAPDMDIRAFRFFLQEFGGPLDSLTLHNYGEPLLHPQIALFIRLAVEAGIHRVDLTTNGNVMTQSLAYDLVDSGLHSIRFSVDALDPRVYRSYRRGGDIARVLDNIRLLADTRLGMKSRTPRIEAQGLLMRHNGPTRTYEARLTEAGADEIRWKTFNVFMSGSAMSDSLTAFLPEDSGLTRYANSRPEEATNRRAMRLCNWPWERIVILADGTIVPCCHDFNGDYVLGCLDGTGGGEVWNTPQRRKFMMRRIIRPESIPMCRRCSSAVPSLGVRRCVPLSGGQGGWM